jgi:hypothetical protein
MTCPSSGQASPRVAKLWVESTSFSKSWVCDKTLVVCGSRIGIIMQEPRCDGAPAMVAPVPMALAQALCIPRIHIFEKFDCIGKLRKVFKFTFYIIVV